MKVIVRFRNDEQALHNLDTAYKTIAQILHRRLSGFEYKKQENKKQKLKKISGLRE